MIASVADLAGASVTRMLPYLLYTNCAQAQNSLAVTLDSQFKVDSAFGFLQTAALMCG